MFEKKGSVLAVSGRAAGGVRRGSDPRSADGRPVSAFPFSLPFTAFPSEQCNDWTGCEVVCVTAGGTGAGAAGTSRACSSAARLRRALRIRGCCWPARLPSTGETSLYSQSVYLPPTGLPSTATAGQSWAVSQGKAVFQRRKAAWTVGFKSDFHCLPDRRMVYNIENTSTTDRYAFNAMVTKPHSCLSLRFHDAHCRLCATHDAQSRAAMQVTAHDVRDTYTPMWESIANEGAVGVM